MRNRFLQKPKKSASLPCPFKREAYCVLSNVWEKRVRKVLRELFSRGQTLIQMISMWTAKVSSLEQNNIKYQVARERIYINPITRVPL
jgi:hypothetical protein